MPRFLFALALLFSATAVGAQNPPVASAAPSPVTTVPLVTPARPSARALAAGKTAEAETLLAQLAAGDTSPAVRAPFLIQRGLELLRLEQWKLAELDFAAVLRTAPDDIAARSGAAYAAFALGRFEAARNRLNDLQLNFPQLFIPRAEDTETGGLALIVGHLLHRHEVGAYAARAILDSSDDTAEDYAAYAYEALVANTESELDNGELAAAELGLRALTAMGAADLPACRRLETRLAAAQHDAAVLDPDDPVLARLHYALARKLSQPQLQAGQPGATFATLVALEPDARAVASASPSAPSAPDRQRLLARLLALLHANDEDRDSPERRNSILEAARLFAGTPLENDPAATAVAAANLAALRQFQPRWPLADLDFLPSTWGDAELQSLVDACATGPTLTPGDPRLRKALALWQTQLARFTPATLASPVEALRLGEHYRAGAALLALASLTTPPNDESGRQTLERRRQRLIALSFACSTQTDAAWDHWRAVTGTAPTDFHNHYQLAARYRGAPWDEAPVRDPFRRLTALAGIASEALRTEADLPGPLPWKLLGQAVEQAYAAHVARTKFHDQPLLLAIARLRARGGDFAGALDLLPLLASPLPAAADLAHVALPRVTSAIFSAEVAAFAQTLRPASPATAAAASLSAWLAAATRVPAPAPMPPLPTVAETDLRTPAVALLCAAAQIVASQNVESVATLLDAAAPLAGDSTSFPLLAPELKIAGLQRRILPLYLIGQDAWNRDGSHLRIFDQAALDQHAAVCRALQAQLTSLRAQPWASSLPGLDRLDYQIAFAAGDFATAAKTKTGQESSIDELRGAQTETIANAGLASAFRGDLPAARATLAQAEQLRRILLTSPEEIKTYQKDLNQAALLGVVRWADVKDDPPHRLVDAGEYLSRLKAWVAYLSLEPATRNRHECVAWMKRALQLAKRPEHTSLYTPELTEMQHRVTYFTDLKQGRFAIARYFVAIVFRGQPRDPLFERAYFLDPQAVSDLVTYRGGADDRSFELNWLADGCFPPANWDGRRTVVTVEDNAAYQMQARKTFDAVAARSDNRFDELAKLGDTSRTVERRQTVVDAEPPFRAAYRKLYSGLKW